MFALFSRFRSRSRAFILAMLSACGPSSATAPAASYAPAATARQLSPAPLISPALRAQLNTIVQATLERPRAHQTLVELCDGHGHRLTGSPQLEAAIDWALATMRKRGLENVRREAVTAPRWIRGEEFVRVLSPRPHAMAMLGLGNSVGTSEKGIHAEVLTVQDEAGLKALGDKVRGKIVHFNNPMPAWTRHKGSCYGKTVRFRLHGARLAAAQGAVGVLVRSVTAHSLRSPHTGMLTYKDAATKIPAAAISTEDSDYLARRQQAGQKVVVHLKMDAHFAEPIQSANAVAEWVGREFPEEVVLVSGHIDSWDVGQGAHDDGAGVVMAMEALSTFRRLGMRPRRTIRMVLWTNEENGMAGAHAYLKRHKKELPNHVAAIEADAGGFAPDSFGLAINERTRLKKAARWMKDLNGLLRPSLGLIKLKTGYSAPDVGHFVKHGVAAVGLYTFGKHYFDYHHTEADTVDKVDPQELSQSAAAIAALAWAIAEQPARWDKLGQVAR